MQESKSTCNSSARTKESGDANVHVKSVLAHTLLLRQGGQTFRTFRACFNYSKMSDYVEYDRGKPPTYHPQTTQGQIESVQRVGFTFDTEHRILGCFLLKSFRLGWDEGKQEVRN